MDHYKKKKQTPSNRYVIYEKDQWKTVRYTVRKNFREEVVGVQNLLTKTEEKRLQLFHHARHQN
jgi:hypothetical protein